MTMYIRLIGRSSLVATLSSLQSLRPFVTRSVQYDVCGAALLRRRWELAQLLRGGRGCLICAFESRLDLSQSTWINLLAATRTLQADKEITKAIQRSHTRPDESSRAVQVGVQDKGFSRGHNVLCGLLSRRLARRQPNH